METLRGHSSEIASMVTCPQCGQENPPEARFCMRCATKLSQSCEVCGRDNPLGAHFCLNCGTALAAATSAERRVVTVLFADLVGSTNLAARLDPERVRAIVGDYFSAMREEVARHGGTVEKFIGDAVMAVFGLPTAHEDDPQRAIRAAVAMQRRLRAREASLEALHVRIGITTGEVVADPQAARAGEFMVTGEVVNVAARLQEEAAPDAIVVDERTRAATKLIAQSRPIAPAEDGEFAGRPRYQIVELVDHPAAMRLRAPLVGREDEVQFLTALYRRMKDSRKHHLVTVIGAAGVGKTRLVEEVLTSLGGLPEPPQVLLGRCPAYGEGLTYWPIAEMLKQECGIMDSDPTAVTNDKLEAGILRVCGPLLGPEKSRALHVELAPVLGLKVPERPTSLPETREAGDPRMSGDALLRALRTFFTAKATARPLVLVFEDLHWGEESLLELLERLAIYGADAPILTLGLARPDLLERHPAWGGRLRNYTAVSLSPLSGEQSRQLVAGLLKGAPVPADVRDAILAKAEGNPFFIEEILRMLVDGGGLVRHEQGWHWASYPLEIRLPDTIHGTLASRLDLLSPLEKRVIQDAAVAGRVFWIGALTDGGGLRPAEAVAALERLRERELVEEHEVSAVVGDREFAFTHALIRDVAYSTLPKASRGATHLKYAAWLERRADQHTGELLEVLANHYEHAWRYKFETGEQAEDLARKAIEVIRRAGARARTLRTLPEARRLYERALTILHNAGLDRDVALLAELLTDRSEVVKWQASPAVVFEDTEAVMRLAPAIGRQDLMARAWLNRAFAEYDRGRLRPAEGALRKAMRLFRTLNDRHGEAEALEMLGIITEDLRGRLTTAQAAYRQTLELYREMDDPQETARTLARLGHCVLDAGNLDEARALLSEALRLTRESHERLSEASCVMSLAILAHLMDDSPEAIRLYQEAIALYRELGDRVGESHTHRHLGMHYLRRGRFEEAERELQTARVLRAEPGAVTESSNILRGLAEVSLARGNLFSAAQYAEQAMAAAAPHDEIAKATHAATLGKVRAAQGRADEAEQLFESSLAVLETRDNRIDLALTLFKYGEALLMLGRPEPAREVLARAGGLFAEIGTPLFIREVGERLQAART